MTDFSFNGVTSRGNLPKGGSQITGNGKTEYHTKGKPGEAHIWQKLSVHQVFKKKGKDRKRFNLTFFPPLVEKIIYKPCVVDCVCIRICVCVAEGKRWVLRNKDYKGHPWSLHCFGLKVL